LKKTKSTFLRRSGEDAAFFFRNLDEVPHRNLVQHLTCTDDEFIAAGEYDLKNEEVITWNSIIDVKFSPKIEYLDSIENLLRQEAIQTKAIAKERGY